MHKKDIGVVNNFILPFFLVNSEMQKKWTVVNKKKGTMKFICNSNPVYFYVFLS